MAKATLTLSVNTKQIDNNITRLKSEIKSLQNLANKRIRRLETNNLEDSPAYKTYIDGKGYFGVKGKTYNELQQELSRIKKFTQSETSTVKGTKTYISRLGSIINKKKISLSEVQNQASGFFSLTSKVEEYLRLTSNDASAIGYQKIWEAVQQSVKEENIDLTNLESATGNLIQKVAELAAAKQAKEVAESFITQAEKWFRI